MSLISKAIADNVMYITNKVKLTALGTNRVCRRRPSEGRWRIDDDVEEGGGAEVALRGHLEGELVDTSGLHAMVRSTIALRESSSPLRGRTRRHIQAT